MRRLILIVALVATAGCPKEAEKNPLDQLRSLRDAMCKCKDAFCVTQHEKRWDAWYRRNADTGFDTDEEQAIRDDYNRCVMEARAH